MSSCISIGASLVLALCAFDVPAVAEKAVNTTFGPAVRVPANVGFASNVTVDGKALTMIFDNLLVEIAGPRAGASGTIGQTTQQTKVFTVEVPYTTDRRSVKMTMDLRGFVNASNTANARLLAIAGDQVKVVDLTKIDRAGGSLDPKHKGHTKSRLLASEKRPASEMYGDFAGRVVFTEQRHAKNPVCQITLVLLVQSDTDVADSGGALLLVDSLELMLPSGGKDGPPGK